MGGVTVVNVPGMPRSGGGGAGGGLGKFVGSLIKKADDKRKGKELQEYIDKLEAVKAKGGNRVDAQDIDPPAWSLESAQGISSIQSVVKGIFGGVEKDPMVGFFTRDGKFMGDYRKSQRPNGGLTISEYSTLQTGGSAAKPSDTDKIINSTVRREQQRREGLGKKTTPVDMGRIRDAARVLKSNRKRIDDAVGNAFGKADPNDPNRYVYDSPEAQRQANLAREQTDRIMLGDLGTAPSIGEAIQRGLNYAGKNRVVTPEPPTPAKKKSAAEQFRDFLGGDETPEQKVITPDAAPPEVNMRSIGTIGDKDLQIPEDVVEGQEVYDYLRKKEGLTDDQAYKAIQDYNASVR